MNVRVPVLIACTLALGVLTGYVLSYYQYDAYWLIAVVPVTAIIFILCTIFRKKKLQIFTLIFAAAFSCGATYCFFTVEKLKVCDVNTENLYNITGTVTEKGASAYGEYIILDNATADGTRLSGKVIAYLPEVYGEFCDTGYTVSFSTKLKFSEPFAYGKLSYNAEQNVKYTCTPYTLISSTYRFSLFGELRSLIRDTLYDNLSYDTASVCYGMLLGDTRNVDDEALDNFRYGGIAHLFAVSGLHIGLIYGIFAFILKRFRLNKYVSACLLLFTIIFYAGICGFSLSSVRAVVMCAATMFARLFYLKSDGLNNLAFAVFVILLISPLNLFSVGFQLSVSAIGGILLLSNGIKRTLIKIKSPDKIASGVGMTLGAQAGTLPVMTASFGYVSGAGLVLNILIIPLITVLFTVLFAGTVISLVIPAIAGFVMPYAALPLEATLSFLLGANFEGALITGFGAGFFVPLYLLAILIFSDKINLRAIPKSILSGCSVIILVMCVIAQTYAPLSGYKVAVSSSTSGGYALMKSRQGSVLILTQYASVSRIKSFLNNEYSVDLDGVILLGDDYCVEAYDLSLGCNDVFVCYQNIDVQPYQTVEVHYEKSFYYCGISFEYLDGYNIFANVDGVNVFISGEETPPTQSCDLKISLYSSFGYVNPTYYVCGGEIN